MTSIKQTMYKCPTCHRISFGLKIQCMHEMKGSQFPSFEVLGYNHYNN